MVKKLLAHNSEFPNTNFSWQRLESKLSWMKPSCEQSSYELILFLVSHNWWLRFACSLPLSHGCFVQQYVIGAERWSKWFEPSDFTGNIVLWSFKRLCDFKWNNFPFPPQVSRINSCLWVWVAVLQNFFQVNNFPPQVSSCNHSSSIVVMGVSFNAAKLYSSEQLSTTLLRWVVVIIVHA